MEITKLNEIQYNVFANNGMIDSPKLFLTIYKTIPNIICMVGIDSKKIRLLFESEFKNDIITSYKNQEYDKETDEFLYKNVIYILKNNLMVDLEENAITILLKRELEDLAIEFLSRFKIFQKKLKPDNTISLIINHLMSGLVTRTLEFKRTTTKLELNYNNDLINNHPKNLKSKEKWITLTSWSTWYW
jgi:hypothetical protein